MSISRRVSCLVASATMLLVLGGCGTFRENHLLATVNQANETQNIFRISVRGYARATNGRYLAGFFDERAVEAFFNETKSRVLDETSLASGVPPLFPPVPCAEPDSDACRAATAEKLKLVPLGSKSGDDGAFVMILSTNPDAIVSTIGSFVDNDDVVQSTMFLATRGDRMAVAEATATKTTVAASRAAVIGEFETLLTASDQAGGGADTDRARPLAMLQALAAGLAPTSTPTFTGLADAKAWFAALPRQAEAQ